jgi:hypothetical protein
MKKKEAGLPEQEVRFFIVKAPIINYIILKIK